jgi:hypothetical protein
MTSAEKNQIERIPTPNLDRIEELRDKTDAAGDVLYWIQNHSTYSVDLSGNTIEDVVAEFFGIDLEEARREATKIKNAITDE